MKFFNKFTSNIKTKPITNRRFLLEYTLSCAFTLLFMILIMYLIPLMPNEGMMIGATVLMLLVYFFVLSRPFVRRWYAISGNSDVFTMYIVSFFAVIPPVSFIFVIPLAFPFKERTDKRLAEYKKVS